MEGLVFSSFTTLYLRNFFGFQYSKKKRRRFIKEIALVLLCAVALTYGENDLTLQNKDKCEQCNPANAIIICEDNFERNDIVVAHEYCNQFNLCIHGKPFAYECQPSLLFDPVKEKCEKAELVNCAGRLLTVTLDPYQESDYLTQTPLQHFFENNNNLKVFESFYHKHDCSGGKCQDASFICSSPDNQGSMLPHDKCNKFYKCDHFKPMEFTCHEGTAYNIHKAICEWSSDVDCGDRITPDKKEDRNKTLNNDNRNIIKVKYDRRAKSNRDPKQASSICTHPGSNGKLIAHEMCNKFYQCIKNKPMEFTCANGMFYNPNIQKCDLPSKIKCGRRLIPKNIDKKHEKFANIDPEKAVSICDAQGSDGTMIAHKNCNKFYRCHSNKPVEYSCPHGTLYNPHIKKCDSFYKVDCSDRLNSELKNKERKYDDYNENGDPKKAASICARVGSGGTLIAHKNCGKFYKCYNNTPVEFTCHRGTLYNPVQERCDWASNVYCGDRFTYNTKSKASKDSDGNDNRDNDIGSDNKIRHNYGLPSLPSGNEETNSIGSGDHTRNNYGLPSLPLGKEETYNIGSDGNIRNNNGLPLLPLSNEETNNIGSDDNISNNDGLLPLPLSNEESNNIGSGGNIRNNNGLPPLPLSIEGTNNIGSGGNIRNNNGLPLLPLSNEETNNIGSDDNISNNDGLLPLPLSNEESNNIGSDGNISNNNGLPPLPLSIEETNNIGSGGNTSNSNGVPPLPLSNEETNNIGSDGNISNNNRLAPLPLSNEETNDIGSDGNISTNNKLPSLRPGKEKTNNIGRDGNNSNNNGLQSLPISSEETNDISSDVNNSNNNGRGNETNNKDSKKSRKERPICSSFSLDGTSIAHKYCNKFYKCFNKIAVKFTCPKGLLFNTVKEVCDKPKNVVCGNRQIPENYYVIRNENVSSRNGGQNNSNNKNYYMHDIYHKYKNDNNENSYKNKVSKKENNGNNNGGKKKSEKRDSSLKQVYSNCTTPTSDGALIPHELCNKFYKCIDHIPVEYTCPKGTAFNAYSAKCDMISLVACGDRWKFVHNKTNDYFDNHNSGDYNADRKNYGYHTDEYDRYNNENRFNNDDGSRIGESNANNNSNTNRNDESHNGSDSNYDEHSNGKKKDTKDNHYFARAFSVCATIGSNGILIAHKICNKFYICIHRRPVEYLCNEGKFYNPYTEKCDWPSKVDCGDRLITKIYNNTNNDILENRIGLTCNNQSSIGGQNQGIGDIGSIENRICAHSDYTGTMIADEMCNKYYKCHQNRSMEFTCIGGTLFDTYKKRCELASQVECGDRKLPEIDDSRSIVNIGINNEGNDLDMAPSNDRSHEFSIPSLLRMLNINDYSSSLNYGSKPIENGQYNSKAKQACTKSGSKITHEMCNKYYKCDHHRPVEFTCPHGSVYNPYIEMCDWPSNVECGDRLQPYLNNKDEETCSDDDSGCGHSNSDDYVNNSKYNDYKDIYNRPYKVEHRDRLTLVSDDGVINNRDGTNNVVSYLYHINDVPVNGGSNGNDNNTYNYSPEISSRTCPFNSIVIEHEECNKYYKCIHNTLQEFKCPGDTLYNSKKNRCDDPSNVECPNNRRAYGYKNEGDNNKEFVNGYKDISDYKDDDDCNCNPEDAPDICARPHSSGILIAHKTCNKYYKCYQNKPMEFSCSPGLLYDPYEERCDWPNKVECGNRVLFDYDKNEINNNDNRAYNNDYIVNRGDNKTANDNDTTGNNDKCNCDPNKAPYICAEPDSSGTLIAHKNCNTFYVCNEGKALEFICSDNQLYDPYKEKCDLPSEVDCGDRLFPTIKYSESNNSDNIYYKNENACNCNPADAPLICAIPDTDGVLIAHEQCNKFYKCHNEKPEENTCPNNTLYNPYKEKCDLPKRVICGDRKNPLSFYNHLPVSPMVQSNNELQPHNIKKINNNPGEAPSICTDKNCNDTEECVLGKGVECYKRIISGSKIGNDNRTNYYYALQHDTETPDNQGDGNDNHSLSICLQSNDPEIYIPHENCNQFYRCINGTAREMSCEEGLLFNPLTNLCDWPINVDCGRRIKIETDPNCPCNPKNAPHLCARKNTNGKLIAHENCNQYYVCIEGHPKPHYCNDDLLYNIETEDCDFPQNVDCSTRYTK